MGSFSPITNSVSVSAMCQGGAALCAYGAGVLIGLAENPHISIEQIRGTSMGGLNAAFFAEGYAKGGKGGAIERINEQWEALTRFEKKASPLWYSFADSAHEACTQMSRIMLRSLTPPWIAQILETQADNVIRIMRDTPLTNQPQLRTHPILDFFTYMQQQGKGLDSDAIPEWCSINATRARNGQSIWQSTRDDIVIFKGKEITPYTLAAGGTLEGMMPGVYINGILMKDGGYSANPATILPPIMPDGRKSAVVEIRARPAGAYPRIDDGEPQTPSEARGYFNTTTDRDLHEMRERFPQLPFYKAEPKLNAEPDTHLKPPELVFDEGTIQRRMEAGRKDGRQLAAQIVADAFQNPSTPTDSHQRSQHFFPTLVAAS